MNKHKSDQSGLRVPVNGRYALHGAQPALYEPSFSSAAFHGDSARLAVAVEGADVRAELEDDGRYGWTLE